MRQVLISGWIRLKFDGVGLWIGVSTDELLSNILLTNICILQCLVYVIPVAADVR